VLALTTRAIQDAVERLLAPPAVVAGSQRGGEYTELDLVGTSVAIDEQLATSRDPAERHRLAEYKKKIAGQQGPGERGPGARGVQALLVRDVSDPWNRFRAELETWITHAGRLDPVRDALTERMQAVKRRETVFAGATELFSDLTPLAIASRVVAEYFDVGPDRVQRILALRTP